MSGGWSFSAQIQAPHPACRRPPARRVSRGVRVPDEPSSLQKLPVRGSFQDRGGMLTHAHACTRTHTHTHSAGWPRCCLP